MDTKSDEQMTL